MIIGIDTFAFEVRFKEEMADFFVELELGMIVSIEVGYALGDDERVTVGAALERLVVGATMGVNVEITEGFELEVVVKIRDDKSLKDNVGSRVEVVVGVEESSTVGSELGVVKCRMFNTSLGDEDGIMAGTALGNIL